MAPSSGSRSGNRHGPRMVEMKVCEGNRMGSNLFYPADNTGYLYRVKRRRGSTLYFSCARNGCRATANFKRKKQPNTKKGLMKGLFEITSNHGHAEDPSILVRLKFESACKKRSMYEETPYSVIIKEEKLKWQVENIKEAGLISTLYQARKRSTLDGPPASDGGLDTEDSLSDDDNTQLSAELSYTRSGYRVERWKWVIAMFKNKGARLKIPKPSDIDLPDDSEEPAKISEEGTCELEISNKTANRENTTEEEDGVKFNFPDLKVQKGEVETIVGDNEESSEGSKPDGFPSGEEINEDQLLHAYGLDRLPLFLPCVKKCPMNPFCLTGYKIGTIIKGGLESKLPLTQQPRAAPNYPVGLQNSTSTAWINPGLQIFYHLRKFRNAVNSLDDFNFDTSLTSLAHLLQVLFAEMETHAFKTVPCESGSILERIGVFAEREASRRDTGNENGRTVSEFMESTIDWLVAETSLATTIAPLFTISMTRMAQWQCSKCSTVHQYQVSPSSCYSLGAYVSEDQAKLQHCMDLQSETQSGVQLVCGQGWPGGVRVGAGGGGGAGCGAAIKVDRVVTPKMTNTPYYLIIKNNSILSLEAKRRLHVVFPDHLNLSDHTLDRRPAHYVLSAVVFHHGGSDKLYTAQIKTEGGRWFSFHEESALEMSSKQSAATQANPQETHPNYLSQGGISFRYKNRGGVRVSRSALLWLYTLVDLQPANPLVPPRATVMKYINSQESQESKQRFQIQSERQDLLKELPVRGKQDPFVLLPEVVLNAWTASEEQRYVLPRPLLDRLDTDLLCRHGNLKPMAASRLKCIRRDMVPYLVNSHCGINTTSEEQRLQQQRANVAVNRAPSDGASPLGASASPAATTSSLLSNAIAGQNDQWKKYCSNNVGNSVTNVLDLDSWKMQHNLQSPPMVSIFNVLNPSTSAGTATTITNSVHSNNYLSYNNASTDNPVANMTLNAIGDESAGNRMQEMDTGLNLSLNQPSNLSYASGNNNSGNVPNSVIRSTDNSQSMDGTSLSSHNTHHQYKDISANASSVGGAVSANTNPTNSSGSEGVGQCVTNFSSQQLPGEGRPRGASPVLKLEEAPEGGEGGGTVALLLNCPFLLSTSSLCRDCVASHARHIRFLERLRRLHRQFRREAVKYKTSGCKLVGAHSLDFWPKIASKKYVEDNDIDLSGALEPSPDDKPCISTGRDADDSLENNSETTPFNDPIGSDNEAASFTDSCKRDTKTENIESRAGGNKTVTVTSNAGATKAPVVEYSLVNEDIVCEHGQLNPQSYVSWLPEDSYSRIAELCKGSMHPAALKQDFDLCVNCQDLVRATETACEVGLEHKRKLNSLFIDKKRPQHAKDSGKQVVLLDKIFVTTWKSYIRSCMRGTAEPKPKLSNSSLLCQHRCLHYNPTLLDPYRHQQVWVLVWPDEWMLLSEFYGPVQDNIVMATLTREGFIAIDPGVCLSGCVDTKAEDEFEAQFIYNNELIHIKQITSPDEVPQLCTPDLATECSKPVLAGDAAADINNSAITSDSSDVVKSGSVNGNGTVPEKSFSTQSVDGNDDETKEISSVNEEPSGSGDSENRKEGIVNAVEGNVIEEATEHTPRGDKVLCVPDFHQSSSLLSDQVSSADGISDPPMASSIPTTAGPSVMSGPSSTGTPHVSIQDSMAETVDRKTSPNTERDEQRDRVSEGAITGSDGSANVREGSVGVSDGPATSKCSSIDGTANSTPHVVVVGGDKSWDANNEAHAPCTDVVDARPDQVKCEVFIKVQEPEQHEAVKKIMSDGAEAEEQVEALDDRQEKPCNPQQKRLVEEEEPTDLVRPLKSSRGRTRGGDKGGLRGRGRPLEGVGAVGGRAAGTKRGGGGRVAATGQGTRRERSSNRRKAAVVGEEERRIAHEDSRLSRVSQAFSSTDTIKTVQSFIAEHTGVWPVLQVIYLRWSEVLSSALSLPEDKLQRPVMLSEDHVSRTLGALRIKPGDTIYYQTAFNPDTEVAPTPAPVASRGQKIRRALKAKKILKKALAPKTPTYAKKKVQTGRTVELHVTEGSRLGSQLVYPADDTGYVYRVKRIKKTTIYFSCGYTGCRACGNFKKKGDSMIGIFDLTSHHNHKRNPTHLRRLKFESVCKKRNLEEDLPASVIIKEELERWQLREEDVNLHTLNSTLYKARWRLAVDDPSSVPDVSQQQQQQQQQQHYSHQLDVFTPKLEKQTTAKGAGMMAFPHHIPPMHLPPQPPHQLDRF